MADPHLADDESVVLAAENIRVRSFNYPALVLTNKRVLLIRSEGEKMSAEEFLLSDLRSALVSQAARDNPTLLLSYVTARGEARRETIVFPNTPEKNRKDEVREWAKTLSDKLKPLPDEEDTLRAPPPSAAKGSRTGSPAAAGGQPGSLPQDIVAKHGRVSGLSFPDVTIGGDAETPHPFSRKRIILGAIGLVVIVVLALLFLLPHAPSPAGTVTPVPTMSETPVSAATTEPVTLSPTAPAALTTVQLIVPSTGVWIRIQYSGNYTGMIGSSSDLRSVSDSGDHLYQQAITRGSVRAIVDKEDSTNRKLTVDIYKDGKVVPDGHGETTLPKGEVNLQIELAAGTPKP